MEYNAAEEIPEDAVIETDANRLGYISGGATLEYTPTFYEAKDDLGVVTKSILTEETASFKSGILTFDGTTLGKLCSTGRVTEVNKTRTVKIGGVGQDDGKKYVIHFVHIDKTDGDIRVTIVGRNEAGFSLAFQKNKETVIDAEFKCQSLDSDGTLIIYKEEIKTANTEE
jgi:hypothetical protein